ncbi:MAG: hypothetical protein GYA14_14055 [Ignavibacteria bacterium]|nr:hypothetical protein [Ignavibacteria bacterium]
MTGSELIEIIVKFVNENVLDTNGNKLIPEIIYENKIPTKNPVLIIKYPTINMTWEGNIIHETWNFELYLVSPVTLNVDTIYKKLEPVLDELISKIKSNPELGDAKDIYLCDINERIEPGSLTYIVNKTNYDFAGFKFGLTIYNWEV